jgi:hypothetical protein
MAKQAVADATLHYVDPDAKLGRAIGKFVVAWGDLERQLDSGFHVLFRTDPTLAMCLCANLGTKPKIEALKSAIVLQAKLIGNGRAQRAIKVLFRIEDMSGRVRLITAHGQVQPFLLGGEKGLRWELVRQVARGKPKITVHPATARYWNAQAKRAPDLGAWWRQYVAEIHSKIGSLSPSELADICEIEIQVARSERSTRRKNKLAGC